MNLLRTIAITAVALLIASPASAVISSAVNAGSNDGNDVYVVIPNGLGEDVDAFIDRTHEYNGADGSGIPAFLLGADYVQTANDDKTAANLTVTVTLDGPADLYLFIDNRVGDNNNSNPPTLGGGVMDWVAAMGFVDTGLDIGIDESGDGTGPGQGINQTSSIFVLENTAAGVYVFEEQNNGGSRNNYGLAAVSSVPEPATASLALLGGLALLRRRRA